MWWRNYPQTLFQKIKIEQSVDQYSKVFYILFLLFGKMKTIEID